MNVTIRPFAESDRAAVGALLAAAFPDKLAAMLGDRRALRQVLAGGAPDLPCGPALFAALLPAEDEPVAWVAVAYTADSAGRLRVPAEVTGAAATNGSVVGYLEVRESGVHGAWHAQWSAFRRHLGIRRALRALLFFAVFHSARVAVDELFVDTVAVLPSAQGLGTGSSLVRCAIAEARRRGKEAVLLYCIERNVRARDVYLRAGFRVAHHERLWWLRWLLGFSDSYLMRVRLGASVCPSGEGPSGAQTDFS